jgi:hypothetical protein
MMNWVLCICGAWGLGTALIVLREGGPEVMIIALNFACWVPWAWGRVETDLLHQLNSSGHLDLSFPGVQISFRLEIFYEPIAIGVGTQLGGK